MNLRSTATAVAVAAIAAAPIVCFAPAAGAIGDPVSCASSASELLKVRTYDQGSHDRATVAERRSVEAQNNLHAAEAAYHANPTPDNAQALKAARAEADRRRAYVAEVDLDTRRNAGELVRISVLVDRLCDNNSGGSIQPPVGPPTVVPVVPVVPGDNPPADNPPAGDETGPSDSSGSSSGSSTSQVGEVPGGQGVNTGGGALAGQVA